MKKLLGLLAIYFYTINSYGLINISQDYNEIIDCSVTKLKISSKKEINEYKPYQIPESNKRISVEIKANKKNNELFIFGLSNFLNYDARFFSEDQYLSKLIDEKSILLGLTNTKKTHKETVIINRITGKLEHVTYHDLNLKDAKVETLYYNCKKAVQKF